MGMNQTIIQNLSHTYINNGKGIKVISEFSLTVNANETIALLGPSGCGKSTILRCIASLLKPTAGTVFVNDMLSIDALKQKRIGFAFQEAALLEWATVMENILLPGIIGPFNCSENPLKQKGKELLSLMGLDEFDNFYPAQLSGGMKQRVALARALLLQPSLLLLDEPFGSLDLLTRSNLIIEFSKILSEISIPCIMVTHSIDEAVFLADKVLILSPRPCKIVAEVYPNLNEKRSFDTFDSIEFTAKVAACRKLLFKSWSEYEALP
jgi:NitT/TauT family transport system ATP-binding protein